MKFCCEDFRWRYTTFDGMGLNIRVVKMKDLKKSRSFYITEGYQKRSIKVKNVKIKFCPFCGVNLQDHYENIQDFENAVVEDFLLLF